MPRLSSVERLPQRVRAELDRRLIANGFGDYLAIEDELRVQGYNKISKSALGRYGRALKHRVQLGRVHAQLEAAGVDKDLAAELAGDATLVVVIDRRNGRARMFSLPGTAVEVIAQIKRGGA